MTDDDNDTIPNPIPVEELMEFADKLTERDTPGEYIRDWMGERVLSWEAAHQMSHFAADIAAAVLTEITEKLRKQKRLPDDANVLFASGGIDQMDPGQRLCSQAITALLNKDDEMADGLVHASLQDERMNAAFVTTGLAIARGAYLQYESGDDRGVTISTIEGQENVDAFLSSVLDNGDGTH